MISPVLHMRFRTASQMQLPQIENVIALNYILCRKAFEMISLKVNNSGLQLSTF
jgi:hypothetical protein